MIYKPKDRRGILGIESAIVMIAFVVVAAALAFVVLNAGFGTTQQAKTTISSGLQESSSALEIAGTVTGKNVNSKLTVINVPLKVSGGSGSVNVEKALTSVRYVATGSINSAYENIYAGTISNKQFSNFTDAINDNSNPCQQTTSTTVTCAFIWWSNNRNNNDIIDAGETATLTVVLNSSDQPSALDHVKIEITPAKGSVLTVERQIPTLTTTIVNLE